jgi:hypothetical protein
LFMAAILCSVVGWTYRIVMPMVECPMSYSLMSGNVLIQ